MNVPNLSLRATLLAAIVLVGSSVALAAVLPAPRTGTISTPHLTQLVQRYGPFPTMRRANEVANNFRQQGCSAIAFHNGDGYYVDVRC